MHNVEYVSTGGSIEALKNFLNTKTEPDFVLAVTWILQALRGKGPFAIEALRRGQCAAVEIVGVFVAAGDGEDVREQNLGRATRVGSPQRVLADDGGALGMSSCRTPLRQQHGAMGWGGCLSRATLRGSGSCALSSSAAVSSG